MVARRLYDSSHVVDGPLGIGWISSVAARLRYTTYLYSAPSTYQYEVAVILPTGLRYVFVKTGGGSFTPPLGRHDTLIQNGDGTFDLTFQFTRSKFHFGADGSLQTMTDDYGNTLTVAYDGSGRVQQISDSSGSGRYLTVSWGADGRISGIQDSSGRTLQYTYTPQGSLQTVTDPLNRVTTYSYTAGRFAPLLTRVKDHWNRVVSDITYETTDRVHSYTEHGETYTYTYSYQNNPNVTAKTDSQGKVTTFTFVNGAYITDKTPPAGGGGTEHKDIAADGTVQQIIDPAGVSTQYGYNSNGSISSITHDATGSGAVRYDYAYDTNFSEKETSIIPKVPSTGLVDPNWQASRYDYYQVTDPAPGSLHHVYRVESDGSTLDTLATYVYDSHGRVTRVTSATGGTTDYAYDSLGNLQTVTGPANNDAGTRPVTAYGYDSLGRVTSVTDPLNHATSYTYDGIGRVTSVTLPKPSTSSTLNFTTTYTYDNFDSPSGLVFVNVTDPNSRLTKQGYDQYGQLVKSIDGLNTATIYGYTRGLLTSITDANNNVTGYAYDSGRRLITTTFPDGAAEHYTYTSDSLLYQKTDRKNQTITFAYDHFKRIATKTYPGSSTITYTYQGQKLTQVVDTSLSPTETHTLAYDSSYRLQSETQAGRGTITRTYNADDTAATVGIQSGPTSTYAYYADGSLNTIQWSPVAGNFKYSYTLPGQYQAITFPNGQSRNFTYDDQGRLTQLSNLATGGTNVATYGYGYDLNYTTGQYTMLGQRVAMTATVPSQGLSNHQTNYEYDPSYQLLKVTYPNVAPFNGEVDSWTYDAIGNRLTNTINGSITSYTYQKIGANPLNWQRLTSDSTNSYTYDSNGSALTRTGYTFGYNSDNRMASISGATTASYLYDYQGRRSTKTVGSATTYLYDGLNLVREAGASSADYLFGPGIDEPLAMSRGGQVYYYETDSLGSVNAVTDSSAVVQNTYLYDAWGQVKSQTGSLANAFSYTSREVGEAGLNFYRARYYGSGIGRFFSEDPLRGAAGPTFYGYALGNPIRHKDPFGLNGTVLPGRFPWYETPPKCTPVGPPVGPPFGPIGRGQNLGAGVLVAFDSWLYHCLGFQAGCAIADLRGDWTYNECMQEVTREHPECRPFRPGPWFPGPPCPPNCPTK